MDDKHTSYLINAESLSYQLLGYSGILHSDDSFLLNVNQVEQILDLVFLNCVSVRVIYWLPPSNRDLVEQFLEFGKQLEEGLDIIIVFTINSSKSIVLLSSTSRFSNIAVIFSSERSSVRAFINRRTSCNSSPPLLSLSILEYNSFISYKKKVNPEIK